MTQKDKIKAEHFIAAQQGTLLVVREGNKLVLGSQIIAWAFDGNLVHPVTIEGIEPDHAYVAIRFKDGRIEEPFGRSFFDFDDAQKDFISGEWVPNDYKA